MGSSVGCGVGCFVGTGVGMGVGSCVSTGVGSSARLWMWDGVWLRCGFAVWARM